MGQRGQGEAGQSEECKDGPTEHRKIEGIKQGNARESGEDGIDDAWRGLEKEPVHPAQPQGEYHPEENDGPGFNCSHRK